MTVARAANDKQIATVKVGSGTFLGSNYLKKTNGSYLDSNGSESIGADFLDEVATSPSEYGTRHVCAGRAFKSFTVQVRSLRAFLYG